MMSKLSFMCKTGGVPLSLQEKWIRCGESASLPDCGQTFSRDVTPIQSLWDGPTGSEKETLICMWRNEEANQEERKVFQACSLGEQLSLE